MAYGVKYRLEFSDVLTKGKKIEILKDGYTGSVLPIVGQAEPVVIKWNANDDPYNSPIIGSVCTLNLFTTDTVTYDDFYEHDEREYKVKISYKDTSDVYQTYWVGYLVVDRFKEQYKANPVAFSLNAYDGLGTLDNYFTPIGTNPFNENIGLTNANRIATILNHLDLGLNIYIQADLMTSFGTYPKRKVVMTEQLITNGRNEFINKFDLPTGKKQLEAILKNYNCRIFQSYGRWYIVENSNIFDANVKSTINTSASSGTTPTGIQTSITAQLVSANDEVIQTDIYNSSGVYQSNSNQSVLKIVPTNLKNVGGNLVREYIQPINEARYKFTTTQNNIYEYTRNVGFEYGSYGWVLSSYASLVTDDFSQQGRKAIKFVNAPTSGETLVFNSDYVGQTAKSWNFYFTGTTAQFGVFAEKDENLVSNFTVQVRIVADRSPNFHYWDDENSTWTTTETTITRTIEVFNNWQTISIPFTGAGYPTNFSGIQIGLQVLNCTYGGSGIQDIYFDNVGIIGNYFKPSGAAAAPNDNRQIPSSYIEFAKRTSATNVYSDKKLISGTYYFRGANGLGTLYNYKRTRDTVVKPIFHRHLQNIMNDYREFQVRYEGTFRNMENDPVSMHNRIWFNFGTSVAQDPQSCYIDGLEYRVKSANAKVIAHLPNDDDDISCDFRITSE
jgi:hypothetical protein